MANIPKTSVALLRAIAEDPESSRWTEFYSRYQPCLAAYLQSAFRSKSNDQDSDELIVNCDEVIQDTMITFMKKVKEYHYDPEEKGFFHNYLIGIAKYKAMEWRAKHKKDSDRKARNRDVVIDAPWTYNNHARYFEAWQEEVLKIAVYRLMNDKTISTQNKEIFRRVALNGESAESVACAFEMTRNCVDQIKFRLTKKLRELIESSDLCKGSSI